MAPSEIHINNKIHNKGGFKWPLESKKNTTSYGATSLLQVYILVINMITVHHDQTHHHY